MAISKVALSIYTVAVVVLYGEVVNPSLFSAIELNLGVVTISQSDGLAFTTLLLHMLAFLSIVICLANLKLFLSSMKKGFRKHPLLISEINRKLQDKTGSDRDTVNEAKITGIFSPIASTGAWTSIGVGHGDISVRVSRLNLVICFITAPISTLWLLKHELLLPLLAALTAWIVSI